MVGSLLQSLLKCDLSSCFGPRQLYPLQFFFLNIFLVVLGIELGTSHVLDKYFTTEKLAQTKIYMPPSPHFEARSCYISQAGLELMVLPCQPPECWDTCVCPHAGLRCFLNRCQLHSALPTSVIAASVHLSVGTMVLLTCKCCAWLGQVTN